MPIVMEPQRIRVPRPRVPKAAIREFGAPDFVTRVLSGCCVEAERADRVGLCLEGLRNALPETLHPHLTAVIDQLQITSQLLRDLADKSMIHLSQVPVTIDYLNVILPCLCRTLRDIMEYYEDRRLNKEYRWRTMYHNMSKELPGTTLPARFVMYNQFLSLLNFMLTRNPNFDMNAMEALRQRILELREVRKIDPPSPIRTDSARKSTVLDYWQQETDSHWAEAIFTQPTPTRRVFRKRGKSDAFGPRDRMGLVNPFPGDVKILVKQTFENDRLSIIIFLRQTDLVPFILIRTRIESVEPMVSIYPIDHVMIERESPSVLHLSYVNYVERYRKSWATLSFITWEELVLFYCTFVSLKACNMRLDNIDHREFVLKRERRLFQAQITEGETEHCLVVVEDFHTKGRRLHVMMRDGPMPRCPVWTAFVPPEPPEDWLIEKGQRRVWVRDLHVYSFSDEYHPYRQRRGRLGAFEIKFAHPEAATNFKQLLCPDPDLDPYFDEELHDEYTTPSDD
ncbi:hypothetical protein GGR50DRAFT_353794 [Xylaria sp. CBS 124048]|nr:hypothetical protein GGR50DRAFT_353794 [Xylaria sp. CBS 124048]